MRSILLTMFTIILSVLYLGCAGSKSLTDVSTGRVPVWYQNPPTDDNNFFGVNTQTSVDMQTAFDKAKHGARQEIARQVRTQIDGLEKDFMEELGSGENTQILQQFNAASKQVVSTALSGSKVNKQEVVKHDDKFRAYVLMSYPIGASNKALMEQIKDNEEMYTRFRSSKVFKELEEEIKKYEERRQRKNHQW
ncbi:MAG: hypothetical protein R6V04_13170 [bacterium]